jgi:hypothetical protein
LYMTSALNLLQRLSGSKYLIVLACGLFVSACSPQIQPPSAPAPKAPAPVKEKPAEVPVEKFSQATISLLLPFKLNEINPKTPTKAEVEKAALAIDFYQGFLLGLDSAAGTGFNFNVKVFDTRGYNAQIETLVKSGDLSNSNLIVGPVFPEGMKYFSRYSITSKVPVVSPLAASLPEEFNNPNLISIVNNIHLHATKIGNHITRNYNSAGNVVVLLNPKNPGDEILASPLRQYFNGIKDKKFAFQEYASVFSMEMKLIKDKKYVVVLTSADKRFVTATIDKLIKMQRAGLNVRLYGHPGWAKQSYAVEKLQALNTIISASYKVDYRRIAVINFVKKYREKYQFEPSEYAFKGYDIGLYFGKSIANSGPKFIEELTKHSYRGLHNNFAFVYDEKLGYINTSLMLLQYKNFALNTIE